MQTVMRHLKYLLSLLILPGLSICPAFAQQMLHNYMPDAGGRMRDHVVDMDRMLVNIRIEPEKGMVSGSVTHYFKAIRESVDSIVLDGPGINYKSITLDGTACKYKTTDDGVIVYMPAPIDWKGSHAMEINYSATPKRGIYFIGYNDSTNRRQKQIWTQGEEVDNRYWVPGYDDPSDKLITEMEVTVDKNFKVLSNGKMLSDRKNSDGTVTWHYRISHPHCFYLTMLGIGDYSIHQTKNNHGVPIYEYYYPKKPEQLEPTYRYTERIMNILEKEIGVPFPWESYSEIPVGDFLYGAMENTTATTFGDFYMGDAREFLTRNYIGVNAHEMTHQWFGDLVSAQSPRDQWLQESFATFYPNYVMKTLYGQDAYDWARYGEAQSALAASKIDQNPIVGSHGGTARIYAKGAFVLGMLSYVSGHDGFQKSVKNYLDNFAYANANTNDLYMSFYKTLGLNLDWFFDEWLYRGGEPDYHVHYDNVLTKTKSETDVYIDQVQELTPYTDYFKMPLTVEVHYKDGSTDSKTETIASNHYIMDIPNPTSKVIDFVLFDPGYNVLKTVKFDKTAEEWQSQALRAPNMLDRYEALVAMRPQPMNDKRDALIKMFRKETFHAMKEEILTQLAPDTTIQSWVMFLDAFRDKDAAVRLAALQNVAKIPDDGKAIFENLLEDSSYTIMETDLQKLCADFPENKSTYLQKTDKLYGLDNTLRMAWLQLAYMYPADTAGHPADSVRNANELILKELDDYTTPAFEFRTRDNAFKALMALNYLDKKSATSILDASLSWNGRLASPAREALGYFNKQVDKKALINHCIADGKWTEEEKTKLRKN